MPLWLRFGETKVGHATGFFWRSNQATYLITNWHVVTGRNPTTLKHIHPKAAEPDHVELIVRKPDGSARTLDLMLSDDGTPSWLVHPELGRTVDIIAIPVRLPRGFNVIHINELPERTLKTLIGSPMFILGFPFEPGTGGATRFPVWKQATVATEPDLTPLTTPYMLVDTASRPGMSGAPVIQRAHGLTLIEAGEDGQLFRPREFSFPVTKLVGIYSGRLHTNSPLDAQLGMVWPKHFIVQVVEGGKRDDNP